MITEKYTSPETVPLMRIIPQNAFATPFDREARSNLYRVRGMLARVD